jgi:GWxTD domain-containing protein
MRNLRPVALLIGWLCLVLPLAGSGQKADADDNQLLEDVRPLILPDERTVFEKLKDESDRLVFQEIFWARRDPNLATPENEFQQAYEKNRKIADRRYSVPGTIGSATDCGRLFILFGPPDDIEHDGSVTVVATELGMIRQPFGFVRRPETWVYRGKPGRPLAASRVAIDFDAACRAAGDFGHRLDRLAAERIVHPSIGYEIGKDGHLVPLARQLAAHTLSR